MKVRMSSVEWCSLPLVSVASSTPTAHSVVTGGVSLVTAQHTPLDKKRTSSQPVNLDIVWSRFLSSYSDSGLPDQCPSHRCVCKQKKALETRNTASSTTVSSRNHQPLLRAAWDVNSSPPPPYAGGICEDVSQDTSRSLFSVVPFRPHPPGVEPVSLQEACRIFKSNFVAHSERRQQDLKEFSTVQSKSGAVGTKMNKKQPQQRKAHNTQKQSQENTPPNHRPVLASFYSGRKVKRLTHGEMVHQSRSRFLQLNEVRERKREKERKETAIVNRIRMKQYQQTVLTRLFTRRDKRN